MTTVAELAVPFTIPLTHGLAKEALTENLLIALQAGELSNRALAFYLADMSERRVHLELGHPTTEHFAVHRLGMSRGRARDLIATGRRLEQLPVLAAALSEGTLSWSKTRRIARVATPETEHTWITRCKNATHEEVDALVGLARHGDEPPAGDGGLPGARFVKKLVLDVVEHDIFEHARQKLEAELQRPVTDQELVLEGLRLLLTSDADGSVPGRKCVDGSMFRIAVDGEPDAGSQAVPTNGKDQDPAPQPADPRNPPTPGDAKVPGAAALPPSPDAQLRTPAEEKALSDARVPEKLRAEILARDDFRCCNCASRRSLMIHHVIWFSLGGETHANNLITLCARCHGLVHDYFLFVSGYPGNWSFRDRKWLDVHATLPMPKPHRGPHPRPQDGPPDPTSPPDPPDPGTS